MKILRIVIVLPIFFGAVTISSAQFSVGAKGGINFNSFRGDQAREAYEPVPGFNGGVFIKHPLFSFLTVRAEALYFKQGGNIHDYVVMYPDLKRRHARVAFHNLQIPVFAEFGLPSLGEDNLQPKLLLGFFYSQTFSARESYVNVAHVDGYKDLEYNGFSDVNSLYNNIQYGLVAAIAAEMKIFSKPVSIEFRYNYNLNQVNRPGTKQLYNMEATHDKWGDDLYLSTLSINVGVTLFYF